ncbi:MAG: ribosome small subunit-dependent GTPase A [Clostridiales bacterium]|nr:ribosome small subunit-dependent GTPase A [Clostridiales bacterium]
MSEKYNGLILKGIGGFYYVETAIGIFECKARGIFRKQKITPLAGDKVIISVNENTENTIDEIGERKNFLLRPPVANIDVLAIVVATVNPKPSTLIIDKLTAIAFHKDIDPVLIITKTDLGSSDELTEIYNSVGIKTVCVSSVNGEGIDDVKNLVSGKICVFTGNSAVGKSTLLNALDGSLSLKTGEYSQKLGRGRHTTREVELFPFCGGYLADTPGFSSLDFEKSDLILKDELPFCFPEFEKHLGNCKFTSCTHTCEKGCKIVEAVSNGEIPVSRHNSYVSFYNDAKNIKEWEL